MRCFHTSGNVFFTHLFFNELIIMYVKHVIYLSLKLPLAEETKNSGRRDMWADLELIHETNINAAFPSGFLHGFPTFDWRSLNCVITSSAML